MFCSFSGFSLRCLRRLNKKYSARPLLTGLFFCLASAKGAGILFCPAAIQPHTSVYSAFCRVNAVYTTHTAKQRTGLYKGFSCDLTHSTAYNTRLTQADITPPAPRRALYRPAQPAYYNNVYKGASLLWIHARQCNIPQTMPARRGQFPPSADCWQVLHPAHLLRGQPNGLQSGTGQRSGRTGSARHLPPGGAVQQQGRGGRRGTIGGFRRISFRAFAR